LPREEWRSRGPRGLARGVGCQGKKVAGRRCGKSIEAQPSFGQIKPREVAWDASPDSPGDGWRQAPPTHEGQPRSANSIPPTQASAGRYRSDLAPFLTSSARLCRSGLKKVPAAEIACARPNAPAAIGLSTRKFEQRSSAPVFWRPMRPSCPSASCSTRSGHSRALSRQGSSPPGAKRRSRFERSRRARPKGRRPTLVLVSVWVLVLDCSFLFQGTRNIVFHPARHYGTGRSRPLQMTVICLCPPCRTQLPRQALRPSRN